MAIIHNSFLPRSMRVRSVYENSLFDLDHTLVRCNLSYEFGRFLFQQGYFSKWSVCLLVMTYSLQWAGLLSAKSIHRVSFFLLFRKKKGSQVARLVRQFIEVRLVPLLRPSILVELERAKEEGDF